MRSSRQSKTGRYCRPTGPRQKAVGTVHTAPAILWPLLLAEPHRSSAPFGRTYPNVIAPSQLEAAFPFPPNYCSWPALGQSASPDQLPENEGRTVAAQRDLFANHQRNRRETCLGERNVSSARRPRWDTTA